MGKEFEDDADVAGISEEQAQRLVEWITDHGHSLAEAYHAIAYVMNATPEQNKIG